MLGEPTPPVGRCPVTKVLLEVAIDPATNNVIARIPADKGAHNLTFSADRKLVFVANVGANNVTISRFCAFTPVGEVATS